MEDISILPVGPGRGYRVTFPDFSLDAPFRASYELKDLPVLWDDPTLFFVVKDSITWAERKLEFNAAEQGSEREPTVLRLRRYMKESLPPKTYIGLYKPPMNGYFRIEVFDETGVAKLHFEGHFLEFIANTTIPRDSEKAEYRVYGYKALWTPGERRVHQSSLRVTKGSKYTMNCEYIPIQSAGEMKGAIVLEVSPETIY